MKNLLTYLAFGALLLSTPSCRHNPLKTSEKELVMELQAQEKEKIDAEKTGQGKIFFDTPVNIPVGFRYKEDRSVDPDHPPVIIDFSGEISSGEIRLSDVASKVRYIVFEVPDDSIYFLWGSNLNFMPNGIIINNNLGINRFDRDGKFMETICKNTFNAPLNIDPDKPFSGFFPKETFQGAWGNHVKTAGSAVFYKYSDYPGEKVSLLKFKADNKTINMPAQQSMETGKPLTFSKGEVITSGKEDIRSGTPGLSSTGIFPVSEYCYAGMPSLLEAFEKNRPLMVTFSITGDTLCEFTQFDHLETSITSSVIRSYSNSVWQYGQVTTIKWTFNDTVFRLVPPNRLIPAYVFRFGKYKVTAEEWMNVNVSFDDKILINEILENQDFLFIEYSYYSTNRKTPKWEKALFDKSENKLYYLVLNDERKNKMYDYVNVPGNPWAAGLENDLDLGLPFWPSNVTPEGKLAVSLRTDHLKRFIKSAGYNPGNDPRKAAFEGFVKSLKTGGKELVVMIAE